MPATLSDLIHTLTQPHLRRAGENIAHEDALLDILEDCVASTTSSKAGGGGGRGTPVDLGALDLAATIRGTIDEHHPLNGLQKAPLRYRLNAWYANTWDPNKALMLHEHAAQWVYQIRELIEPTKRVPLRGIACPECHNTHLEKVGEETTYNPAITVYPDANPVYAQCGVCENEWSGKKIHELASKGVDSGKWNM